MIKPDPQQEKAIALMVQNKSFALDADIGAGKTLPAFLSIKHLMQHGYAHANIVCTPSGRKQWLDKAKEYDPGIKLRVRGEPGWCETEGWNLIAYTDLSRMLDIDPKQEYMHRQHRQANSTIVLLDESHSIKTWNSKRTRNVFSYYRRCARKYIMTGTKIGKGLIDIYTQYRFLDIPGFPKTKAEFMSKYCVVDHQQYFTRSFRKIVGYKNIAELNHIMRRYSYWFQASKPSHRQETRHVELTDEHRLAYERMLLREILHPPDVLEWRRERDTTDILPAFLARAKACRDLIRDGMPTVILYHYRAELPILQQELAGHNYALVSGGLTQKRKSEQVDLFQSGAALIMIAQIKTLTDSIDLHAGQRMIFTGPTWSLIDYQQAVGRISRRSQTRPTTDIMIVIKETIDEKIQAVLRSRETTAESIKAQIEDTARARSYELSSKGLA